MQRADIPTVGNMNKEIAVLQWCTLC